MLKIKYLSGERAGQVKPCPNVNPLEYLMELVSLGVGWELDTSELTEESDDQVLFNVWSAADTGVRMKRAIAEKRSIGFVFRNDFGYKLFSACCDALDQTDFKATPYESNEQGIYFVLTETLPVSDVVRESREVSQAIILGRFGFDLITRKLPLVLVARNEHTGTLLFSVIGPRLDEVSAQVVRDDEVGVYIGVEERPESSGNLEEIDDAVKSVFGEPTSSNS